MTDKRPQSEAYDPEFVRVKEVLLRALPVLEELANLGQEEPAVLPGAYQGRSRKEHTGCLDLDGQSESKLVTSLDALEQYHRCADQLTSKQRQALYLYFGQGKTQQEIAQVLGKSRSTISGLIRRARKRREKYDRKCRREQVKYFRELDRE